MSDYLGNLAARALGVSVVARPRRLLFDPQRATSEPLALEPAPAEEASRTRPTRRERTRAAKEVAPQHGQPTPAAEIETEAPPVRVLPAERPPARAGAVAAQPPREPAATPAGPETRVRRAADPPLEPATRTDPAIETAAAALPARAATEPSLAARPSFPTLPRRDAPEPTVRVTIGRIDVRAVKAEEPPEMRKKPRSAPRISLDEYLARAREGAG